VPTEANGNFWAILFTPEILLTIFVCMVLAALTVWIVTAWQGRKRRKELAQQRERQEATIERVLDSVARDKDAVIADYEEQLERKDAQIAALESQVKRLRDRMTSSGLMGLFGGNQREAVSALLLENEQLHELLTQKQLELRELMADMTGKLMDRIDQQAQESARAVRYKQALLSAFLQQEETRQLLNNMIAEGQVAEGETRELPREASEEEPPHSTAGEQPATGN
jgi:hypothetical protein